VPCVRITGRKGIVAVSKLGAPARAALLGIATGMRAYLPLAVVTSAAARGQAGIARRAPFLWLANRRVGTAMLLTAGAEVVADKLPTMHRRTTRLPMTVRVANGAALGAAAFAEDDLPIASGAIIGAVAAACAASLAYRLRILSKRAGVPNVLSGLVEDFAVVRLSMAAVDHPDDR
jgi:uncharacterized membrane protein